MIKVSQVKNNSQTSTRLEAKFGTHITIDSILYEPHNFLTVNETLYQNYKSNKAFLKRLQGSLKAAHKAVFNQEKFIYEYMEDLKTIKKEISKFKG